MKRTDWIKRASGLFVPPTLRWSPGYPCCCGGSVYPGCEPCLADDVPSYLYVDATGSNDCGGGVVGLAWTTQYCPYGNVGFTFGGAIDPDSDVVMYFIYNTYGWAVGYLFVGYNQSTSTRSVVFAFTSASPWMSWKRSESSASAFSCTDFNGLELSQHAEDGSCSFTGSVFLYSTSP